MLLYTKIINGVKKIYAAPTNIPSISDTEVVYKDIDGDVITLNADDTYVDATYTDSEGNEHGHGIVRLSDGKFVSVYAGNVNVIPGGDYAPAEKILSEIKITKKPTKLNYVVGDTLSLDGLKVTAIYESGDKETVTSYTASPEAGSTLSTAGDVTVTITFESKTADFKVSVSAAE